jgi:hypothetical protein
MRCNATDKVRHASRGAAVLALRAIDNAGLAAYRCKSCKGWHLGHRRELAAARIEQLLRKARH